MRYMFKKRWLIKGPWQNHFYLDIHEAASGEQLSTICLSDGEGGPGYSVHCAFVLSEDERYLKIRTGKHCMGEHVYATAIYFTATGAWQAEFEEDNEPPAGYKHICWSAEVEAELVFDVPAEVQPVLHQWYNQIVSQAIKTVLKEKAHLDPAVTRAVYSGAIESDPRRLVVWYAYSDEGALALATRRGHLAVIRQVTRRALCEAGYPGSLVRDKAIDFTSEQALKAAVPSGLFPGPESVF